MNEKLSETKSCRNGEQLSVDTFPSVNGCLQPINLLC